MFIKEFVQLRRDRLTFGTMIFIPLLQLLLFGFAINTTPRHLPTAVLAYEDNDLGRSILAALSNTSYFKLIARRPLRSRDGSPDALGRRSCSASRSRQASSARCGAATGRRCWSPPTPAIRSPPAPRSARSKASCSTALARDRGLPETIQSVPAFEIRQHRRYNPAAVTSLNIVPGLLGTILTMTMLIFTALSVTREIERGTMESLLAMPIRAGRDHARQDRALMSSSASFRRR